MLDWTARDWLIAAAMVAGATAITSQVSQRWGTVLIATYVVSVLTYRWLRGRRATAGHSH